MRVLLLSALLAAPASLPASAPDGSRFVLLPPAATGVTAANAYPELHGRFEEIMRGALGSGVAIADLDGDGRPDLVVTGKSEGLRCYRNHGDWRFEDITDAAGLAAPPRAAGGDPEWYQGISAADVDGDGDLDLHVCRIGAENQLFINDGRARFTDEAAVRGVAVRDGSNMAAFADYDRDGWLDFYLQTNIHRADHRDGEPDRLFRNTGRGYFVETTATSGLHGVTQGHGVVWCDYDEDGWPDIYVANDFEEPDRLYRNQGDGTFRDVIAEVMPSIANSSMGLDTADVDGDGRFDFFVADMAATTPEKDLRGMVKRRLGGVEPLDRPDALRQYPANSLLLNTGAGRFVEAAHHAGLARTDWTWSVLFGDFDQDGRPDLHVTNGIFRELHNIDLAARSAEAVSVAEQMAIIRTCPVYREPNLFYVGRPELRFEECATAAGLADDGVSFGAATGDLDGDGDLDLVYVQFRKPPAVYRNDYARGRSVIVELRSPGPNRFGVGAKVTLTTSSGRQVRDLQQARGYLSTSEPMLHFGLPDGDTLVGLEVRWPSGRRQQVTGLVPGQRVTVVEDEALPVAARPRVAPPWWREVAGPAGLAGQAREAPDAELIRQPLVPAAFNRAGPALAAADLNGDGLDDLVSGATTVDPGTLLLSNGRGGYIRSDFDRGAAVNRGPLVVADFDRDGDPEVLVTSGGNSPPAGDPRYGARLWQLGATGQLEPRAAPLPSFPGPVGALAVADFDRDGWLDVVVGGRVVPGAFPAAAPVALWRGGPGGFRAETGAAGLGVALGLVTSLLATDADGDGWTDLLVAREWDTLQFWRNEAGRGFRNASAAAGLDEVGVGLWHSLAAGDFNGDGCMDYAVGNLGTNTTLAAMPGETAVLYSGSFSGAAGPQVIEAVRHGDREWPRRGLATLGSTFRSLPRRFPSNDRFAAAGLTGILPSAELAQAERRELREKRSGILWGTPDGRFRFSPLPWPAQLAPLQGMLAVDADGDGALDLVAAQNAFDAIPEHGRADAGLGVVLRGDGRGGFSFVPWSESGWSLPGDARGLVATDFDRNGWPDFYVTRNNRPSALFLHQRDVALPRWRIGLREGPGAGGPAWGARLTVVHRDGARYTVEFQPVTARNSQSAPFAFVASDPRNPVVRLEARWPDGRTTRHAVPSAPGGSTLLWRVTEGQPER